MFSEILFLTVMVHSASCVLMPAMLSQMVEKSYWNQSRKHLRASLSYRVLMFWIVFWSLIGSEV